MQDIPDHSAGRRGDDPNHPRQERQRPLAASIEQTFVRELPPPVFKQLEQRAFARQLHLLDHHLVLRAAGEGGKLSGANYLHTLFRLDR